MKKVVGIANFGLLDSVKVQGCTLLANEDFTLADVLLPQGVLGRILTGEEAERQRIHTGLSWPKEAKIRTDGDNTLRRAPVSVLWRAFVERGDRFAVWKSSKETEFSVGRMLAQSVLDAYDKAEKKLSIDTGNKPQPVVAIPNSLDEAGQEVFLRECIGFGMPEPYLLWRPVAAALSWLRYTEPTVLQRIGKKNHNHILILYFGVDAFEFTVFKLKPYIYGDQTYILPLRDRPTKMPLLAGMDWAGNIIEPLCSHNDFKDFGAYWQLFTTFPEVWQAIAAEPFDKKSLPRPWSTSKGWQFWNPKDMDTAVNNSPAQSNTLLRKILEPSCALKEYNKNHNTSFPTQIALEIEKLVSTISADSLQGVLVCGPLVSVNSLNTWLRRALRPISKTGIIEHSNQTLTNHLWLSLGNEAASEKTTIWLSPGNKAVSEGAAIYGERRLANIPAYLDTMPQLSLFTENEGERQWHPLLKAQEVLGGEEYKDAIKGKFVLPSGRRQLEIVLCKGAVPEDSVDSLPNVPKNINPCQARLVRYWVRTQGNYESVQKYCPNWARDYALNVAACLFSYDNPSELQQKAKTANHRLNTYSTGNYAPSQDDQSSDVIDTPYRNNKISFPITPEKDILLDVRVTMKPAAGLAKITFSPRDKGFMNGQSIKMNYSTMKPCLSPPKSKLGWPSLLEIAAHPEDKAFSELSKIRLIDTFEKTHPKDNNYLKIIEEIKKKCLQAPYKYNQGIMDFSKLYPLTENGNCCTSEGREQLSRIIEKFSNDFSVLKEKKDNKTIQTLLSKVTWLYAATPPPIIDYIRTNLDSTSCSARMRNILIESASKCFTKRSDIHFLFERIVSLAECGKFTIQSMRSASRVLRFRDEAPSALTEKTALTLAQLTLSLMKQEADAQKFAVKFFQGVLLLLYLLRFRKVDNKCFSPQNDSSIKIFEKGMNLIKESVCFFISSKDSAKVEKSKAALKDYEDFVHQRATGRYPQAVLDLTDDDDEED